MTAATHTTTKFRAVILDMLERAGSSAAQQFLVIVLGGGLLLTKISGLPWLTAIGTAGGAFVISLLTSLVTLSVPKLPYWPDLLIRVAKTFGQSLLATLGAGVVNLTTVPWLTAINTAAVVAFMSLVKGLVARNAPITPSLLKLETLALVGPPSKGM